MNDQGGDADNTVDFRFMTVVCTSLPVAQFRVTCHLKGRITMTVTSRRKFLVTLGQSAVAIPLTTFSLHRAHAARNPKLPATDPLAVALQYVELSTISDQTCSNCRLYASSDIDDWGTCTVFPGKLVAGEGWCMSWVRTVG